MENLENNFSRKIRLIKDFTKQLNPDRNLIFRPMKDLRTIKASAGAAYKMEYGVDYLEFDDARIDESLIAHELLHIIISRSNWPGFSYLSSINDPFEKDVVDTLDNIMDHFFIYPQLQELKFDFSDYWRLYLESVLRLKDDSDYRIVISNSLRILDIFIQTNNYKEIIKIGKTKFPVTLELSRQLHNPIFHLSKYELHKKIFRDNFTSLIKIIDDWLESQNYHTHSFQKKITSKPIYSDEELIMPSTNFFNIKLSNEYKDDTSIKFFDRRDNSYVFKFDFEGKTASESRKYMEIELKKLSLGEFLNEILQELFCTRPDENNPFLDLEKFLDKNIE